MKRTYRVTFPDGTFEERSTKSMSYRFAICDYIPEGENRPAHWAVMSWSQSTTPAVNAQRRAIRIGYTGAKIFHVELMKGAEVEWRRDEGRGVAECFVVNTANPKKWPMGAILNTVKILTSFDKAAS